MNTLENIDFNHQVTKALTITSVTSLMGEYFDNKYYTLTASDRIDFQAYSYLDYLILPLLGEKEQFRIAGFLKFHLNADNEKVLAFKESLNKIVVLDDLVELLILLKYVSQANLNKQGNFDINIYACIYSFRQMKNLKDLNSNSQKLQIALVNPRDNKDTIMPMQKNVETLLTQTEYLQQQIDSKISLLNCINILHKKEGRLSV